MSKLPLSCPQRENDTAAAAAAVPAFATAGAAARIPNLKRCFQTRRQNPKPQTLNPTS